jgi:hypothetical protein
MKPIKQAGVWLSCRKRWDEAEKNKKGTLYRARVKFDRVVKYDGSKESIKAIKDLILDAPMEFRPDGIIFDGFQYPIGMLVCINLTGSIDLYDEETFNCLFEPV